MADVMTYWFPIGFLDQYGSGYLTGFVLGLALLFGAVLSWWRWGR
jgi:hypothetical protein